MYLDVEPSTAISKLELEPALLDFEKPGDSPGLEVRGTFADGTSLDITQSSQTQYKSFDTSVATVDQYGRVKAVGPGQTTVMATFNDVSKGTLVDVSKPKRNASHRPPITGQASLQVAASSTQCHTFLSPASAQFSTTPRRTFWGPYATP